MKKLLILLIFGLLLHVNAKEYVLDTSHSHVGFSIKHMMISNVKGDFKSYDADLEFDPKTKTFTKLEASVDVKSINTGIEKRDNHLKSADFFDVSSHPMMKFTMTEYFSKGDTGKMYGNLTIRGTTKIISFDTNINGIIKDFQGNERIGFTLESTINRKDFGLTWNKLLETGGVAVGDDVKIVVEVEALEL